MKQKRIGGALHAMPKGSTGLLPVRWYLLSLLLVLFGSLSLVVAETLQEPQVEYSADEYMETEQITMKAKVYYAPNKERREQEMEGMKQITITRRDKGVIWMLMPEQKMYMEMSMKEGKEKREDISGYKIEQTVVGEEVINGIKTTKSKVIVTDPKGNKLGGFMWTTKEGIALKMDVIGKAEGSKMRMKRELKNLKIGKQGPKLFEIPASTITT